MNQLINQQDLEFLLYDLLDAESLLSYPHYEDHSRETFDAFIEIADKIARKHFLPHNAKADAIEPEFDGDNISIIAEVKPALEEYTAAGFIAARHLYANGGMQMPAVIASACQSFFFSANPSTAGYPFLSTAASNLIAAFASESQKRQYLPGLLDGRIFGTMALTEPDVGSSLGDLKTSATAQADGSYLIKGQKMFISAGDHPLSENIVHLVLARMPTAPVGVKGISLFIVPKFLLDENAENASRNDVQVAGLLHKMGYRGITSTVLNFGDKDNCQGYLVGEPNQGLLYMFKMMNEARIGVGLGAAMIGYRGYLSSLEYARNRPQGRLPSNRDSSSKPVKLIEHADVRRMLLAQKSYVEGSLALCLYAAKLMDLSEAATDTSEKLAAGQLLDLLTPVVKSFPSTYGTKANDLAIQVLGGSGYTRDYPVEQCYRDNRLNPIHEGTEGIQALDLLGRKLWQDNNRAFEQLLGLINDTLQLAEKTGLVAQAATLKKATGRLAEVTRVLGKALATEGADKTLANASLYLDSFGRIVVAWLWLKQAVVAKNKLSATATQPSEQAFLHGKIQAASYYINWELPEVFHLLQLLEDLDPVCFEMQADWF
ncbi:MAG: acyl-CoA dehydrogenase [Xanthomonadales bacterium]|nr:acyl-CoA dehydrogenase [Xanthomonadales bacterium]